MECEYEYKKIPIVKLEIEITIEHENVLFVYLKSNNKYKIIHASALPEYVKPNEVLNSIQKQIDDNPEKLSNYLMEAGII